MKKALVMAIFLFLGGAGCRNLNDQMPQARVQPAQDTVSSSAVNNVTSSLIQFAENETFSDEKETVLYENKNLGFSFKYPQAYQNNRCDVRELKDSENTFFTIGSRMVLTLSNYADSLDSLAKQIKTQNNEEEDQVQLYFITLNGERALKKTYRLGGLNRYGELLYLLKNKKLYELGFTAGGFNCGFEPTVYENVVKSFKLTSP